MEEANQKIQGQYDLLLKKYDDLNHRVVTGRGVDPGRATSGTTRPASRVGAVEYQEPPDRTAGEGLGAEGMGGRTAPDAGPISGAEGLERRGVFAGEAGLAPTPSTMSGGGFQGAQVGISRREAAGIGAQGTEGARLPT